jgi:hypothetical protein
VGQGWVASRIEKVAAASGVGNEHRGGSGLGDVDKNEAKRIDVRTEPRRRMEVRTTGPI